MLRTYGEYPYDWDLIALGVKNEADWRCVRCDHEHDIESFHILTVHHWDGNKRNCAWWNLIPLCQRCHLSVQARVDPNQPFMFEHTEWCKIYAAGFYAKKYLALDLPRDKALMRMETLLALGRPPTLFALR